MVILSSPREEVGKIIYARAQSGLDDEHFMQMFSLISESCAKYGIGWHPSIQVFRGQGPAPHQE